MARKGKGVGSGKGIAPRTRSGSGARLVWLSDEITPNIERIPSYINDTVSTTFRYYESIVEGRARSGAPWTDRTGNARSGLTAKSGREGTTFFLVLAHRVPYGIWLEVRFAGKYAIILPTLEAAAPEIMATMNGILSKFNGRVS